MVPSSHHSTSVAECCVAHCAIHVVSPPSPSNRPNFVKTLQQGSPASVLRCQCSEPDLFNREEEKWQSIAGARPHIGAEGSLLLTVRDRVFRSLAARACSVVYGCE